ncbi:phage tail protein [Miltoncostaea marina]|uniref:phage tail protein n=1 Tax=Miltoncostaea marina TaxID=2843215 RepID=UPI001C3E1D5C|nr:phage tail protein [Miltoncostaea marina]
MSAPARADGAPPAASARAYLRGGLPAIYRESDFGMRFVAALETLLDPIVATLDNLPSRFDSRLADRRTLGLMAAWLGLELDESWPEDRQRELVRRASELARRRGTRRGLEEALRIAFPDLPLRVEDDGGVVHAGSAGELPAAPPPRFVVYCDVPLEEPAGLARMIEVMKPVHVEYRLRIRSPRRGPEAA